MYEFEVAALLKHQMELNDRYTKLRSDTTETVKKDSGKYIGTTSNAISDRAALDEAKKELENEYKILIERLQKDKIELEEILKQSRSRVEEHQANLKESKLAGKSLETRNNNSTKKSELFPLKDDINNVKFFPASIEDIKKHLKILEQHLMALQYVNISDKGINDSIRGLEALEKATQQTTTITEVKDTKHPLVKEEKGLKGLLMTQVRKGTGQLAELPIVSHLKPVRSSSAPEVIDTTPNTLNERPSKINEMRDVLSIRDKYRTNLAAQASASVSTPTRPTPAGPAPAGPAPINKIYPDLTLTAINLDNEKLQLKTERSTLDKKIRATNNYDNSLQKDEDALLEKEVNHLKRELYYPVLIEKRINDIHNWNTTELKHEMKLLEEAKKALNADLTIPGIGMLANEKLKHLKSYSDAVTAKIVEKDQLTPENLKSNVATKIVIGRGRLP